ncbi:reverse transcriptase domain-containing protein [Tanacetum coccineum]
MSLWQSRTVERGVWSGGVMEAVVLRAGWCWRTVVLEPVGGDGSQVVLERWHWKGAWVYVSGLGGNWVSVFRISDYREKDRKWMTEEFCPRSVLQRLEQELYNLKLKGTDIDGYTNRFHELALLCPRMVEPEQVKVEQYIRGLSKNIRGECDSSQQLPLSCLSRYAYQLYGTINPKIYN